MRTLAEIIDLNGQPRRVRRTLMALIDDPAAPLRLEANNMLAVNYWHDNDMQQAIMTFKKTIEMAPHTLEAIWAMRMLSLLYKQLGLRAERYSIDMQRLMSLRRILHFSEEDAAVRFACDELKREWDERDMAEDFGFVDDLPSD